MKADKRILVLGASGRVGQVLVRMLRAHPSLQLTLAARHPPGSEARAGEGGGGWRALDLFDSAALAEACAGQDLVLQCAGPSQRVGDRVARAAAQAGAAYLDPGGYDPLWQALRDGTERWRYGLQPFVLNAGLLPGLSGLLPRALVERALATGWQPERLDVYCVGRDRWTLASALDIIDSLGDFGAETPPGFVRDGRVEPVPLRQAWRRHVFDAPLGARTVWLTRTLELELLARRLAVPEVHAWGANHGAASALVLALSKALRLYRRPRAHRLAAHALVVAAGLDMRRCAPGFALECRLSLRGGPVLRARWSCDDTYEATGLLLALAALQMDRVSPGVAMFESAMPLTALLEALGAHGLPVVFDKLPGTAGGDPFARAQESRT